MRDSDLVTCLYGARVYSALAVVCNINISCRRVVYLEKDVRRGSIVVVSNAVQICIEVIPRVDDFAFGGVPASLP